MPYRTWEDRIYAYVNTDHRDPADVFVGPILEDEEADAREVMGHLRYMAANREPPTRESAMLCVRGDDGWPEDARPINPEHSTQWLHIAHKGQFWEVSYGSQEFSSGFSAVARGVTLRDALYNLSQEG